MLSYNPLSLFFRVAVSVIFLINMSNAQVEPLTLRVLTYNIHHGEGIDGKLDLERIGNEINQWKPDLVALQEVEKDSERTQKVDQAARLGEIAQLHALFGESMPYQGGSYGNAILSRWPIRESKVIPLPNESELEPRTALLIEIEPRNGTLVRWVSTHLDFQSKMLQVKQVTHLMEELPSDLPLLLAGDFNCTPDSDPMKIVSNFFTYADTSAHRTYGSESDGRKIDYILMNRNFSWKVVECRVGDNAVASDHYPLFAVLALSEPPTDKADSVPNPE